MKARSKASAHLDPSGLITRSFTRMAVVYDHIQSGLRGKEICDRISLSGFAPGNADVGIWKITLLENKTGLTLVHNALRSARILVLSLDAESAVNPRIRKLLEEWLKTPVSGQRLVVVSFNPSLELPHPGRDLKEWIAESCLKEGVDVVAHLPRLDQMVRVR